MTFRVRASLPISVFSFAPGTRSSSSPSEIDSAVRSIATSGRSPAAHQPPPEDRGDDEGARRDDELDELECVEGGDDVVDGLGDYQDVAVVESSRPSRETWDLLPASRASSGTRPRCRAGLS